MFQPHGFGPLKLMKDEFIDCFADEPARGRRADHARAGLFRRHGRPRRDERRHRRAASRRGPRRASRFPTARRAATSSSSWPGPATASSSWARATTRCRNSPPTCCGAWLRRRESRPSRHPPESRPGSLLGAATVSSLPAPCGRGSKGRGLAPAGADETRSRESRAIPIDFSIQMFLICSGCFRTCRGCPPGAPWCPAVDL